jgi:FkbM family methyltransferase
MFNNIRKLISKFKKYSTIYEDFFSLVNFLNKNKIDTVLDIGANKGQYAQSLRRFGFKGRIISFEPLNNEFNILKEKSKNDPNWIVGEQIALGNKKKKLRINVAKNSVSSSLKKIKKKHLEADKNSEQVGAQFVIVNKIDNIIDKYCSHNNKILLKSDTQGYELEVLQGAIKTLKKKNLLGIQVETSLVELYHSENIYVSILKFLDKRGFEPFDIFKGFRNKKSNQLLQIDFLFGRK